MHNISLKKVWVATSGWRGYESFTNSVAGANDTGNWSDSPCPTPVREYEVSKAKTQLRKAGIRHRTAWARTSNCFSIGQHILVAPEDRPKAIAVLKPLESDSRLLWVESK